MEAPANPGRSSVVEDDPECQRENVLDQKRDATSLGATREDAIKRCSAAIKLEWQLMPVPKIVPGMSRVELKRAKVQADIARARRMIGIWEDVRDTIAGYHISGRVRLETDEKGDRVRK